jgi:transcriptional/translational regulatory protein YebC/TACO1
MGVFTLKADGLDQEMLELELIDAGLEELGEDEEGNLIIRCSFNDFGTMQKALEDKGLEPLSAEVEWIPTTTTELTEEEAEDVLKLVARLEEDDDVQKVFHNLR